MVRATVVSYVALVLGLLSLLSGTNAFTANFRLSHSMVECSRLKDRRSFSFSGKPGGRGWPLMSSKLSATDAKKQLLGLLSETTKLGSRESEERVSKIDLLVNALTSTGQNKYSEAIDGDWALVMSRNAKGSPSLQKASNAVERLGGTFQNFNVAKGTFDNYADVLGGRGRLFAGVEYKVLPEMGGSRISADIVEARLEFGKIKLPLPLRVRGGWLDFLYVDEDLRITKGNKGGLFVHVRPSKLREVWGIETN